ncbi:leucine_Rich Repeat (LRR)-containing protein [Hexamita inflata]|uniref:Partial n=1 Tax=Hexamita inflata TaxID=28002 RepID=A0AA86QVC1_9EUKA|nr:leucine Rich Repeat (LRR)-containing protein [Hexamita inflata]
MNLFELQQRKELNDLIINFKLNFDNGKIDDYNNIKYRISSLYKQALTNINIQEYQMMILTYKVTLQNSKKRSFAIISYSDFYKLHSKDYCYEQVIRSDLNQTISFELVLGDSDLVQKYAFDNELTHLVVRYLPSDVDIAKLNQLKQITMLDHNNCQLGQIQLQNAFQHVKFFSLVTNKIIDLTPLSQYTQITDLNLSMNLITDLRPISGLVHMIQLNVFQNKIADLTCLRHMQQLKYLDVSYNENIDIWGLQFLCGLQSLKITKCNVSDLSPIQNLINLKSLQAVQNKLTQINEIKNLQQLTYIDLQSNFIQNREPYQFVKNNALSSMQRESNKLLELKTKTLFSINHSRTLIFKCQSYISKNKLKLKRVKEGIEAKILFVAKRFNMEINKMELKEDSSFMQ